MPTRTYLISVFMILAIPGLIQAQSGVENKKLYSTACQTYAIDAYFVIAATEEAVHYTFSEKSLLYCSPDETSKVLDTIGFNHEIHTTDVIERFKQDTIFSTEVASGRKTIVDVFMHEAEEWLLTSIDKKVGYIKKSDLAAYASTDPFFLAGFVGDNNNRQIELRSFNAYNPHVILDTHVCTHYFHVFEIKNQLFNGLANTGSVIRYTTNTQSCPSATYHEFIEVDEGKFTYITSGMSGGETNIYDMETIYLPLKFESGKVLLVADGDWENIFNYYTGSLNTFNYPEQIGVPIEYLIVITKEHTEEVLDANGEPQMENEYDHKVKVVREKPQYFRWDGEKLTKVTFKTK